uniref:Uncharacterized protein n=2 Tax=viral metagenome TaxID=1070528 RepID=A0A6M3IR11_9ZZZZ
MRLIRYINEESDNYPVISNLHIFTDDMVEYFHDREYQIEKDAKFYFTSMKGTHKHSKFLFRGSDKKTNYFDNFKSRIDRNPKDMPVDIHNDFDFLFRKKFGWKARSEGIFATSKYNDADNYGSFCYIFIPIGNFKFIWSKKVNDLYSKVNDSILVHIHDDDDYGYDYDDLYSEGMKGHWEYDGEDIVCDGYRDDAEKIVYRKLEKEGFEDDIYDESLLEWIPNMTLDDFVEMKKTDSENEKEEYMDNIIKSYTDKDLKKAVESKHEIMFKCKEYYLFNVAYWELLKDFIK